MKHPIKIITVLSLLALPTIADAQVRRYDPSSKQDQEISGVRSGGDTQNIQRTEPRSRPKADTNRNAPKGDNLNQSAVDLMQQAIKDQQRARAKEQKEQRAQYAKERRYGLALALVDHENYTDRRVFENLMKLDSIEGLEFRTYIKDVQYKNIKDAAAQMPIKPWFQEVFKEYDRQSPRFRVDDNNAIAGRYGIEASDYPVVIYEDPWGNRRTFRISRSIASVKKMVRNVEEKLEEQEAQKR